jgi:hypothetical protein
MHGSRSKIPSKKELNKPTLNKATFHKGKCQTSKGEPE